MEYGINMGLVICSRCYNAYDKDRWDICPNCARQNLIPRPYHPDTYIKHPLMSQEWRDAPSSSWAEVMSRGGHPLYIPKVAMKINIARR